MDIHWGKKDMFKQFIDYFLQILMINGFCCRAMFNINFINNQQCIN